MGEYQNMQEKLVRQELIIDKLINVLVNKDIITENEVNKLITIDKEEQKSSKV